MELSDVESFDFFFDAIWRKQVTKVENPADTDSTMKMIGDRVVGNIVDTILFQQGKPHKWLFTSVKTGEILKKQEVKLTADNIVRIFKSRCRLMKGCKPYHMKPYIANIWYFSVEVDMSDHMYSRLVDEEELSHILSHHLFADIAAIQLYIGGWPFKGSGVFEHRVSLRQSSVGYNHETVELASLPVDQQEVTMNTFNPNIERMIVTEGHHDTIKFHAAKFTRVIEQIAQAKVKNVVFEVNLNSSLTPIFVCARGLILVKIPENAGKIFTLRSKHADMAMAINTDFSHTDRPDEHKHHAQKPHDGTHPVHEHKDTGHHGTEHHYESEKHNNNQHHHHDDSIPVSPNHDSSKKVKELLEEPNIIHDPSRKVSIFVDGELDVSHPPMLKKGSGNYERFAEYAINKYPGNNGRPPRPATASGTFHRDQAKKEKDARLSAPRGRSDRPASASLHHLTPTEATKSKSSYYLKLVRGDDDDNVPRDDYKANKPKRPASAPVSDVPFGSHGVAKGGRRSSGLESRLKTLKKNSCQCMGDYCGFAQTTESESKKSLNEYGLEAEAGRRTWQEFYEKMLCDERSDDCNQTIAFKSILLAKAETKYIEPALDEVGFELWQLYQQTKDLDQIASGFTRCQLTRVVNRCKTESHTIIFSSQRNEKHSAWDATSLTYKKLVYSEALVNVHPSRFYYTVPVCRDCYRIYTLMDKQREIVLFHRPDVYNVSLDEKAAMRKRQKYLDAYSAILVKEQREERHRKEVENWNAVVELEIKSEDDDDLQDNSEDDLLFEYGIHHNHHHHHDEVENADDDLFDPDVNNVAPTVSNPLVSSVESDGPIEYNFRGNEPSKNSNRDKFVRRMENNNDAELEQRSGNIPKRERQSRVVATGGPPLRSPNTKTLSVSSSPQKPQMSRLHEMELSLQNTQPSMPKQPKVKKHFVSKPQRYPETIKIDTLKGKGVSKDEHLYHKNAKGSMASWARILKESQAEVPQTQKHPPHMGTKWNYHGGNSRNDELIPVEPRALRSSTNHLNSSNDMRRSKSAATSRGKSSTQFNVNKENVVVGKIRPKSAVEAASSAMQSKKPFVSGSKNVQSAPSSALARHQGTLKVYHNATRPTSSKTRKDYELLPLNKYTPEEMQQESEKIEDAIRRAEKKKVKEQQKEWAKTEREQQRLSPERVHPTKGTSDSWRGTVIRTDNKYIAGTDSPFGPAPVFELPISQEENKATSRPKKFASPEMKVRREENGKVVVQLSKTSDFVLPYEYERAKMTEYEALSGYGDNSLSVSPFSGATADVQTQ